MRRAHLCGSWLSLAGVLGACGAASTSPTTRATGETAGDEVAIAAAAQCDADVARDPHLRALESRLATSTAEVRALRAQLRAAQDHGDAAQTAASTDVTTLPADEPDEADEPRDGRPVLRLYGGLTHDVAPLAGPIAPPLAIAPSMAAFARLPVMLTPGAPESVPPIPITPAAVSEPLIDDPAVAEYRAALAHVSAREWDAALSSLGRFVDAHPDHAYADNAMYWRGEVLYARRDYAASITELTTMIERFPRGNKVADALLRIGFAYQRLGESDRAREIFRRVREQYPGTVAARTASREDA